MRTSDKFYMLDMNLCKQSANISNCCFFNTAYQNSAGCCYTNINTNISCETCYWILNMRTSDAFYTQDMTLCKQSASVSHFCFNSTYTTSAGSSYRNIKRNISYESCYWDCIMGNFDTFYILDISYCEQSASISHFCFFTSTYTNSAGSRYTNINIDIPRECCYWFASWELLINFTCWTWIYVNRAPTSRTVASSQLHTQTQLVVAIEI
jgi:hypothetical protein